MPDITTPFAGTDGATRANFNKKITDINAHGNDAVSHVTATDRTKWDSGIVSTYIHTKTGTVHNLQGTGNNIQFYATADIADGDTWSVNGVAITATLQNGDPLPGDLFKNGHWVTGVRLSDDGTRLGFTLSDRAIDTKSISGALTLSTAAPTVTLATGKLWGVY